MFDLEIFRPAEYLDSIRNIDFHSLKEKGVKGLLFDIDDTLLPRRETALSPLLYNFFEELKGQGFKILLLSNNFSPPRVEKFAGELNIPYLATVFKPLPFGYRRAMKRLGLLPREIAVIGDQLFMDILGGNRMGMHTILVKPISQEIKWYRKLMRIAEQWVLAKLEL